MNRGFGFLKQLIMAVAAIAAMVYVGVQISLTVGDVITIESAVYASADKTLPFTAFLFRDEAPIVTGGVGTPSTVYSDGEKVPKGVELVRMYELGSDADLQSEINALNAKIAILEKSSLLKTYSTTDLEALDSSISSKISGILRAVSAGDLTAASIGEDELLILMNRRSSVLTAASGYDMIIDRYKTRISELKAQISGVSKAYEAVDSGYYYAHCDGYENTFTMSKLDNITVEDFNGLEKLLPDYSLIETTSGKLVKSAYWYIVVSMDKRVFAKLTDGKSSSFRYSVSFPYYDGRVIGMTLYKTVSQTNSDSVVAVFTTDTIPAGFSFARTQPVEILSESYTGLKIATSSIRVDGDGNKFVYVLDGTVVAKKTVTMLYDQGNGYCICALPDKSNVNVMSATALSIYDPVIVAGTDLYVGKKIE